MRRAHRNSPTVVVVAAAASSPHCGKALACSHCARRAAVAQCGGCMREAYCGTRCQNAHWTAGHAEQCGAKFAESPLPATAAAAAAPIGASLHNKPVVPALKAAARKLFATQFKVDEASIEKATPFLANWLELDAPTIDAMQVNGGHNAALAGIRKQRALDFVVEMHSASGLLMYKDSATAGNLLLQLRPAPTSGTRFVVSLSAAVPFAIDVHVASFSATGTVNGSSAGRFEISARGVSHALNFAVGTGVAQAPQRVKLFSGYIDSYKNFAAYVAAVLAVGKPAGHLVRPVERRWQFVVA